MQLLLFLEQFFGDAKVMDGLFPLLDRIMDRRQVAVRTGEVRIDPERLLVMFDRVLDHIQQIADDCQTVMGHDVIRLQFHRFLIAGQGLDVALEFAVAATQVKPSPEVMGV